VIVRNAIITFLCSAVLPKECNYCIIEKDKVVQKRVSILISFFYG